MLSEEEKVQNLEELLSNNRSIMRKRNPETDPKNFDPQQVNLDPKNIVQRPKRIDEFFRAVGSGTQRMQEKLTTFIQGAVDKANIAVPTRTQYRRMPTEEFPIGEIVGSSIERKKPSEIEKDQEINITMLGEDKARDVRRRSSIQNLKNYQEQYGRLAIIAPPPEDKEFLGLRDDSRVSPYAQNYRVNDPTTTFGNITQGLTKYLIALAVTRKITNPLTKKLDKNVGNETVKWITKNAFDGIIADSLAFSAEEGNLSDLIAAVPKDKRYEIFGPVFTAIEYLQEKPEDEYWKKKLKQGVNVIVTNVIIGTMLKTIGIGVSKTKDNIIEKKDKLDVSKQKADDAELKTETDKMLDDGFEDTSAPSVDEPLLVPDPHYDVKEVPYLDNHNINFNKIDDEETLEAMVGDLVDELGPGGKINPKGRGTPASHQITIKRAKELIKNSKTGQAIFDALDGKQITPELQLAGRILLVSLADQADKIARDFKVKFEKGVHTAADEARMHQANSRLVKAVNTITGSTSTIGRTLDAQKIIVGGTKANKTKNLIRINKILTEGSGSESALDIANKIIDNPLDAAQDALAHTEGYATLKKLTSVMYASMLSNVGTYAINFVGSGMKQIYENVLIGPTASIAGVAKLGLARAKGQKGPVDRLSLLQAMGRIQGSFHGFWTAFRPALQGFKEAEIPSNLREGDYEFSKVDNTGWEQSGYAEIFKDFKDEFNSMQNYKANYRVSKPKALSNLATRTLSKTTGLGVSTPMRILIGGDAFMKNTAMYTKLYEDAYASGNLKYNKQGNFILTSEQQKQIFKHVREFMENPPKYAVDESLSEAAINTFTNRNAIASAASRLVGKPGTVRNFITRPFMPFVQTVSNLWEQALLNTPFAPWMKSYKDDILKGGAKGDKAVSRMVLGTGLASLGFAGGTALFGDRFKTTGSGNSMDYRYINRRNEAGWHEYQIDFGDGTSRSYDRLDPYAFSFAMGNDWADMTNQISAMSQAGKTEASAYVQTIAMMQMQSIYKNAIERNPITKGIETFGRAIYSLGRPQSSDLDTGVLPIPSQLAKQLVRSFTPGLGRTRLKLKNPEILDVYTVSDSIKFMVHAWAAIPGLDEWTAQALNIYGDNPDSFFEKIPYKINMTTGKHIIDKTYEVEGIERSWSELADGLLYLSKQHTTETNDVAEELVKMNWSRDRLDRHEFVKDTNTFKMTNGEFIVYQEIISRSFREAMQSNIQDQSSLYNKYVNEGKLVDAKKIIDKDWTEAKDLAKAEVLRQGVLSGKYPGGVAEIQKMTDRMEKDKALETSIIKQNQYDVKKNEFYDNLRNRNN